MSKKLLVIQFPGVLSDADAQKIGQRAKDIVGDAMGVLILPNGASACVLDVDSQTEAADGKADVSE